MIEAMTTATRTGWRPRWVVAFLAAVLAVAAGLFTAGPASALTASVAQNAVGASTSAVAVLVGPSAGVAAGQRLGNSPVRPQIVVATGVAANTGSEVLLDTSAVKAQSAAQSLMKPGECAVICSTVEREAAQQGFSTAGLPVVADGTSALLRSQVAQLLRGFGAAARGLENDATIGATALERGVPLITGDRALWNSVLKLGGDARWFAPGT